jgi:hypothetical protein
MIESISGSTKRLVEIRDLLCVPSWPDGRANLLFRIRDS